jgi:predicted rRNA methylase YqxC with S4 and FtsJ domains
VKGNSIEEDIKIIEDFILKTDVDYSEYNEQIVGDISYQAIQHLLSAYQEVLKENDELKKSKITYERVRNIQIENKEIVNKKYISKQKIKEVIKELEENIYRIKKQYSNGGENCNTVYLENLAQVKILKQMLRESEE